MRYVLGGTVIYIGTAIAIGKALARSSRHYPPSDNTNQKGN